MFVYRVILVMKRSVKIIEKKSSTPTIVGFNYVRDNSGVYEPLNEPGTRIITVTVGATIFLDSIGGIRNAWPKPWIDKKFRIIEDEKVIIELIGDKYNEE